jgi:hypothetical protein
MWYYGCNNNGKGGEIFEYLGKVTFIKSGKTTYI